MIDITDFKKYLSSLKNTFIDKAFFVEKLPEDINVIIDYGCADGSFLMFLNNIYGDRFEYYGVDNNHGFIEMCNHNGIKCVECLDELKVNYEKTCINFSSSLHEIFMYTSPATFFTSLIQQCNKHFPKIISIRDMYIKNTHDTLDKEFILYCMYHFVKNYPAKFSDFLNSFSGINFLNDNRECIHFLLKYMYDANWEKEKFEDYLSFTKNYQSLENFFSNHYEKKWNFEYLLPYLMKKWKNDGIIDDDIETYIRENITTHIQMIYEYIW